MRPVRASSELNSDTNREDRKKSERRVYLTLPCMEAKETTTTYKHSHHRSLGSISGGSKACWAVGSAVSMAGDP